MCIASSWAVRNTRMAISWVRATVDQQDGDVGGRRTTYTTVRDENLGEGARVSCSLATHGLDGVHRGAGGTGGNGEYGGKPRRMESRRGRVAGRHGLLERVELLRVRLWSMPCSVRRPMGARWREEKKGEGGLEAGASRSE